MTKTSRRKFLKSAGVGIGASVGAGWAFAGPDRRPPSPAPVAKSEVGFALGLASYTFRAFGLDETLTMARRLDIRRISFKSMHLPLESTPEQTAAVLAKIKAAGLDLYAGGVIYMTTEAEVRRAFEYAKTAGMKLIIGVPNHELLPLAESLAKRYDIGLAIHNHGPTDKLYPTAASVYEKVKGLDRRMGLCLDVGHEERCGIIPAVSAERCFDRLLDVHIKDMSASTAAGTAVEIGRGVIDIPQLVRTLVRLKYAGVAGLEYEKDEKDPLAGAAESIGYVRGVLAAL
jgi:sugar phosphate isomerase/epimerase